MAVVDATAQKPPKSPRRSSDEPTAKSKERRAATWLMVPSIIILLLVIGYPIVAAVIQSFQKDAGLNAATGMFEQGGFAGFSNYTHWLLQQCGPVPCPPGTNGASFWTSIFNTFFFTIVTVVFETVLGLWMALIMNRAFHGRALVRASVLVPWAIPTAVTAKLWFFIFATAGIANVILHSQILWTSQAWPARIAIIIADIWKTTPFMALLILAGLQIIPEDIYEAARVDGASTVQQFFRITLPLIKPALMVAILFRTLDALRMYDLPAILTGGGPGDATTTLSILVVSQIRQGFNAAAALSTLTFLLIFAVAFIFVRFLGANVVQTQAAQQKGELQ
jgi:ABC-type sugar transport system permease subunit